VHLTRHVHQVHRIVPGIRDKKEWSHARHTTIATTATATAIATTTTTTKR
jgi:hypothetical protein